MLFKMLCIQRTWQQYPDMGPMPRQIFVTQSRVLASKVKWYFAKLMWSLEAAADSPEELRERENDVEQEIEFMDQDDNQRWMSDLPARFSELRDEHFPLFITYDQVRISLSSKYLISPFRGQLSAVLQNDIGQGNDDLRPRAGSRSMPSSDHLKQSRRNFVSYGEFLASYWGRLPKASTRVLGEKRRLTHGLL